MRGTTPPCQSPPGSQCLEAQKDQPGDLEADEEEDPGATQHKKRINVFLVFYTVLLLFFCGTSQYFPRILYIVISQELDLAIICNHWTSREIDSLTHSHL